MLEVDYLDNSTEISMNNSLGVIHSVFLSFAILLPVIIRFLLPDLKFNVPKYYQHTHPLLKGLY